MARVPLNEDMNYVRRAPMTITLLDGDLNIIAGLDDEPNDVGGLTAAELKAKFDQAGNTIKTYLNGTLVPELLAADATEQARAAAEAAREQAELRREESMSHGPKIQGGTWWVWDHQTGAYRDTGTAARPNSYNDLAARPSINGHVLTGNQTAASLGIVDEVLAALAAKQRNEVK